MIADYISDLNKNIKSIYEAKQEKQRIDAERKRKEFMHEFDSMYSNLVKDETVNTMVYNFVSQNVYIDSFLIYSRVYDFEVVLAKQYSSIPKAKYTLLLLDNNKHRKDLFKGIYDPIPIGFTLLEKSYPYCPNW